MNMICKLHMRTLVRHLQTTASPAKFLAEPLANRSLIRIQGDQVIPFLQGLVTNDMNHLTRGSPSIYAMFLNKAGRVLYDTIIYRTPEENTFLIECDKDVSSELRRHLRLYRVRRKIEIDCIASQYSSWTVFEANSDGEVAKLFESSEIETSEVLMCRDPRLKNLGARIILPTSEGIDKLVKMFPKAGITASSADNNYTLHRLTLGIGEGTIDHPPSKAFPLEANCDFLHGVSFQKGCYIGQELTARVYHTGVIRKRLMPIALSKPIEGEVKDVQTEAGSIVGSLRGHMRNRALGLLRVEQVLKTSKLMIDGEAAKTFSPDWWPKELPTKASLRE